MEALTVRNLHAYYGTAHVLHGVELFVAAGQVVGVLGRNGMGKTTLLKAIMRLVPCVTGEIALNGVPLEHSTTDAIARMGIAYMPQDTRVFPDLTVEENCNVAAQAVASPRAFTEVLEVLPELKRLLRRRASALSGGEQQLLGVARSLTMRCRVLLMDEPTEGLMPRLVERIGEICRMVASEGVGVLLVEQNTRLAFDLCDRLYILEKGEIKGEGTSAELRGSEILERCLGLAV